MNLVHQIVLNLYAKMIQGTALNAKSWIVGELNAKILVLNFVRKYPKINIYVLKKMVSVVKVVLPLVIFLIRNVLNAKIDFIQEQKDVQSHVLLIVKMIFVIKKMDLANHVMMVFLEKDAKQNAMRNVKHLVKKKTENVMIV